MSNLPRIYRSTEEQIEIQAARGLIISKDAATLRIIEAENYYNLFNGYKDPFLDASSSQEHYLPGTKFEEIYALYLFDRELRNLFIRYILEIENNVKSVLARVFSREYGYDNYLKIRNFDTTLKKGEQKTAAQKIGEVSDLISNMQHEVARQLSKNNSMISHYMLEYGYVPLWVLVNTLTLGTVSVFYANLKQKEQNEIGRFFGLKPDEMKCMLQILSLFRNACAHDERLYSLKAMNRNMRPNNIKATPIHAALHIPKNRGNNYVAGVNDLFAIVILFKTMLSESSFRRFFFSLDALVEGLSGQLTTISIASIERRMGFVSNWRDIQGISYISESSHA